MADWLKKVIEEADRQFKELPEWKRAPLEQSRSCASLEEGRIATSIREPLKPQGKTT